MQPTTVAVSTLQDTVRRAVERFPRERARIERAATLLALGHVDQLGPDVFTVRSQTDAAVTYRIDGNGCPCVDKQRHPTQSCKHEWSVDIVLAAQERQWRLDARESEQAQRAAVTADAVALAYARSIRWAA
jgi:hypothetical protein